MRETSISFYFFDIFSLILTLKTVFFILVLSLKTTILNKIDISDFMEGSVAVDARIDAYFIHIFGKIVIIKITLDCPVVGRVML